MNDKKENKTNSLLLEKYVSTLNENPTSRVFAPLAEIYRKLGNLQESIRILKYGLKNHPSYLLGHITLAKCYYDLDQYELSYTTIKPFLKENFDNISLQKLFASICLNLAQFDEALETYKHILFLNPRDLDAQQKVIELEDEFSKITSEKFEVNKLSSEIVAFEDVDDWVQIDFSNSSLEKSESNSIEENINEDNETDNDEDKDKDKEDEWKLKEGIVSEIVNEDSDVNEFDRLENENSDEELPVITHTLVNLYCSQKHYDKAIEVLNKILELRPDDQATLNKIKDVKQKIFDENEDSQSDSVEGHDNLMSFYDEQVSDTLSHTKEKIELLNKKFSIFLNLIKERSLNHV